MAKALRKESSPEAEYEHPSVVLLFRAEVAFASQPWQEGHFLDKPSLLWAMAEPRFFRKVQYTSYYLRYVFPNVLNSELPGLRGKGDHWLPWVATLVNRRDGSTNANKAGMSKAYFWTVDDSPMIRRCINFGVDGGVSNRPQTVRDALNDYRYSHRLATLKDSAVGLPPWGFER